MTRKNNAPICMTEEYWANSQLSIARYYGHITFSGHTFLVLDKFGRDYSDGEILKAMKAEVKNMKKK